MNLYYFIKGDYMRNRRLEKAIYKYSTDIEKIKETKKKFEKFHLEYTEKFPSLLEKYPECKTHFMNFILFVNTLVNPKESLSNERKMDIYYAANECLGQYFDCIRKFRKWRPHICIDLKQNGLSECFNFSASSYIIKYSVIVVLLFFMFIITLIFNSVLSAISKLSVAPSFLFTYITRVILVSAITMVILIILGILVILTVIKKQNRYRLKNTNERISVYNMLILLVSVVAVIISIISIIHFK